MNAEIRANEPVVDPPDDAGRSGGRRARWPCSARNMATRSACSRMGRRSDERIIRSSCAAAPMSRRPATSPSSRSSRESAVSSGVRRIEALTGEGARQWLNARDEKLQGGGRRAEGIARRGPGARRRAGRERAASSSASWPRPRRRWRWAAAPRPKLPGRSRSAATPSSARWSKGSIPRDLRGEVDGMKQRLGSGVAALVAVNEGRGSVAVGVTDDLAAQVQRGRAGQGRGRGAGRAGRRRPCPTWPRAAARTAPRPRKRCRRCARRWRKSRL